METLLMVVAAASVFGGCFAIAIAAGCAALAEGRVAAECMTASAQQPDEAGSLRGTAFVTMALVETSAIYALVIAFVLIFANPFWDYVKEQHQETLKIERAANIR